MSTRQLKRHDDDDDINNIDLLQLLLFLIIPSIAVVVPSSVCLRIYLAKVVFKKVSDYCSFVDAAT
jgi:hypothetical protein